MIDFSKAKSALDVAQYILKHYKKENKSLSCWRTQKLTYFCQAWSLALKSETLFKENLITFARGPRIVELYEQCKSTFYLYSIKKGSCKNLSKSQKSLIERVLSAYANTSTQDLKDHNFNRKVDKESSCIDLEKLRSAYAIKSLNQD